MESEPDKRAGIAWKAIRTRTGMRGHTLYGTMSYRDYISKSCQLYICRLLSRHSHIILFDATISQLVDFVYDELKGNNK